MRSREGAAGMAAGYVRERLHFERPVTPLFATTFLPATERAYRAASEEAGGRAGAIALLVRDGYVYTAWSPLPERAGRAEREGRTDREGEARPLPELVDLWERERIPEVRALLDDIRSVMRPEVPARRAAGELDALVGKLERLLTIHYEVGQTVRGALATFAAMLRARGDEHADATVATLVAPCESLQRDVEVWLAHVGERDPTREAMWELVHERPGRLDLDAPTWGEQPALARRGARACDAASFDAGTARALAARDAAAREAMARFAGEERPVATMILDALRRARGVQQTLNFLVGEIALGVTRGAMLRAGARLGLGSDVVWLTREELRAALGGEPVARGLVTERKAAHARAQAASPPDTLGEPDPRMLADPALAAMLGAASSSASRGTRGLGASAGRARGPVRVLAAEEDLAKVEAGDVIVVAALEPTWTPAMHRAVAIVAETGGLLSHAAVVAREMGKPAVVGLAGARQRWRSGEEVWVDGASGEVTTGEGS